MSAPVFIVLFVLFVSAGLVIVINLAGDPGIDYWDLDGDNKPPESELDMLRSKPALYGAAAVLLGTFIAYLSVR
jgi:hypothetical protein